MFSIFILVVGLQLQVPVIVLATNQLSSDSSPVHEPLKSFLTDNMTAIKCRDVTTKYSHSENVVKLLN